MKIGLFGGAFNPIHRCHLTLADQVLERLPLDQILFIPTGTPPHKPADTLAPTHHRLEMVRLAIHGHPAFAVSDIEVRRPGTSYSVETVTSLQSRYGPDTELSFLIGLDAFLQISTWHRPGDLLRACRFVVFGRPGQKFRLAAGLPVLPPLRLDQLDALDSGQSDRLDIPGEEGTRGITLLALPPCPISASDIRERIRSGRSLTDLLPPRVESYIIRAKLYREDADHA
jgi:nicotinate-nucleotide adenylyltransferase